MKKWIFVIAPAILFAIFLFFYEQQTSELAAREQARTAEIQKQKDQEDSQKKLAEENARRDAEKRAAEQAAEDAAREKAATDARIAQRKGVQDETDQANAEIDRLTKQASELEIQLDALHKTQDQDSKDDFDLAKQVEQAHIDQRNAELEIQRTVDMIANRAEQSSLTKMPPPLPPPAK